MIVANTWLVNIVPGAISPVESRLIFVVVIVVDVYRYLHKADFFRVSASILLVETSS